MDAGASKLDIKLSMEDFSVTDNGSGFASIEVFDQFFGTFGFDHSMLERTYGRFGIGRGQVMALAKTSWRTADFSADVDIESEGYGYTITPNLSAIKGLSVTGTFYKPMGEVGLYRTINQFTTLARYVPIPITINDTLINEVISDKWDVETKEAFIRANRSGVLDVYSQGILVERIHSHRFGCGGVVVTKRGFALQQNMARAQLITASCPVWDSIEVVINRLARKIALEDKDRKVETDSTRAVDAAKLMAGNTIDADNELLDSKLFTLTDGKHVNASSIYHRRIWTVGEDRTKASEDVHRSGAAAVLSIRTLERFGVSTVHDLLNRLKNRAWKHQIDKNTFGEIQAIESVNDVPGYSDPEYRIVSVSDLTKLQKIALSVTQYLAGYVGRALRVRRSRKIIPGMSESAQAWTDGVDYIAIDVDELHEAQKSLSGWTRMAHLLVHEYLHEGPSNLSHAHSMEFYEQFHEIILDPKIDLARLAASAYRIQCKKAKVSKQRLSTLAYVFEIDEDVREGTLPPPKEFDSPKTGAAGHGCGNDLV